MRRRIFFIMLLCSCGWMNDAMAQKKERAVSILMPFCSQKILSNPNHTDAELGNICREYYQGVLIAMDSFENAGRKIRLTVFDTDNDSLTMIKQMQTASFKESDLIIGPVLQGGNKVLTPYAKEKGIFHVSPLMTFSKTKLNDPYWVSSNPDLPAYSSIMYEHMLSLHKDSANIIIVSDGSSLEKNISAGFKQLPSPMPKTVKIKVVEFNATFDLHKHFSLTLPNYVVIPLAKENAVNKVLYSVKDTGRYVTQCFGFQQWYDFKNSEYDLWGQKNVHILSPFYVDYTDSVTKQFIQTYRDRFSTEPSDAAFKGFDQMLYFGNALIENGKSFMSKVESRPVRMLHTTYNFRKQKEGFYQNMYLNIIRITDHTSIKVN